ncbi:hypothetical protein [Xenorhabdus griffiniae]|uniref:hypothetical protein n=1 Tax=Xenorhabdus griffiniae TaxID=351672 RepID=UPI002359B1E4|nr:hypothetical protein [Xenorhabdus griffiniae]MDC9606551.1 hypothetical protein [Xenorhabdus griffiniae]
MKNWQKWITLQQIEYICTSTTPVLPALLCYKLGTGHYQISGILGYNAAGLAVFHPRRLSLEARLKMPEDSGWNLRQGKVKE